MRRRSVVVGLTALGLIACTRGGLPPERVQAWVGRPAAELVREWGAPTKEVDDVGQRLMVYEEVERAQGGEFQKQVSARQAGSTEAAAAANAAVKGPTIYVRSYLFWVDAAGKITRTEIRQP